MLTPDVLKLILQKAGTLAEAEAFISRLGAPEMVAGGPAAPEPAVSLPDPAKAALNLGARPDRRDESRARPNRDSNRFSNVRALGYDRSGLTWKQDDTDVLRLAWHELLLGLMTLTQVCETLRRTPRGVVMQAHNLGLKVPPEINAEANKWQNSNDLHKKDVS